MKKTHSTPARPGSGANKPLKEKLSKPAQTVIHEKGTTKTPLDTKTILSVLANVNPESVLLIDSGGRAVFSNKIFAKMIGKGPDEIVGKSVYKLLPPERASSWKTRIDNVIATGAPEHFEEFRGEYHTENYLYPLQGAGGKHTQLVLFGIDITERKKMEKALRQSEEKFKELFDSAPVGYHEIDANGRIVNINRTEMEMLGYTR